MAGPIRIAILANGSQARAELGRTAASATQMGSTFGKLGKVVAGAFAIGGLVRAGAAIVKVGADYQDSLNKIQALTGANAATMKRAAEQLEANAGLYAKMGQTTGDAASGVVELTKAGLSLDKSLKAVNATMTLAKAGELSVADASTLVSNTLNTFHLRAGKAADIANVLANAANISSADVSDLAESFKFVAPIAAKSGVTLAQTGAILAELSNSGIKASQAGTGLRKFLLSLQAPSGKAKAALADLGVSIFDATGKMKPLPEVIDLLRGSLGKLTQQQQNVDLKDIFGLVGVTSAQVILENGAKGLADYTKGVQRAGAAQKLAEASTRGLMGTLNSLKASAISLAQSLYRQLSPAVNKGLQPLATWLSKNQDEIAATAVAVTSHLAPAIAAIVKLNVDWAKSAIDVGSSIGGALLPALNGLTQGTEAAAKLTDAIPSSLKSLGIEAGLAALVLPRLLSGISAVTTAVGNQVTYLRVLKLEMSDTAGRTSLLATGLSKLGAVAKQGAGIGGLVLLAQSAHQSNAELGLLEKTAGAAALGFAAGGPWGAAVGAVGGLAIGVIGLKKSLDAETEAEKKANQAIHDRIDAMTGVNPSLVNYKKTLDQVTGAITAQTRAAVLQKLQQDQIISQAADLGLSARTLVSATLGQQSAIARVTTAWQNYVKANPIEALGKNAVAEWIQNQNGALRDNQDQIQANTAATAKYSQALLSLLPKQVRTEVVADGIKPSALAIASLASQYHAVDNKTIRTLIQLSGADTTVAQVKRIAAGLADTGKQKMSPQWKNSVDAGVREGQQSASNGSRFVNDKLHSAGRITADISPFLRSLSGGLDKAKGTASRGGNQIGSALKGGLLAGMAGMARSAASEAANAVAAAVAAAKAKGRISSPSKETTYIGQMLGDGLIGGIRSRIGPIGAVAAQMTQAVVEMIDRGGPKSVSAMSKVIASVLKAATDGGKQIEDALAKYLDAHTKATDKQIAAAVKSHDKLRASLVSEANALQNVNDKLADAKQKLADVIQQQKDYAASVKASVIASADITQVLADDTPANAANIVAGFQDKAAAAEQYVQTLMALKNAGLNATTLQQLLDAGVQGGLATAQGLAEGGKSAVDQVNAIQKELDAAAGHLGVSMSKTMYDAGVQAAKGMVKGLQDQKAAITKIAEQMAKDLVATVKKNLKISSPSRVFRDIGNQTVAGLALGVNQTYVKRTGAQMAADFKAGFAQPQLTARAAFEQAASTAADGDQARLADALDLLIEVLKAQPDYMRAGVRDGAFEGLGAVAGRLERAAGRTRRLDRSGATS